ncbi:hypothetical protein A3I99_00115 [Candidatus Kaiserbacteria bacterium RIFCSPLOWO2_02_FULL_45_11b]|uniref:Uncharacterized protein n=1 Tax=Candidatus Kaiserbacteria bacterium RIFCSPLOWO2_12_FULL_45_26 TaxID=1798525 RepID=A0A1F6FGG6_9BACT|nr:MAG: hypothetical protein A2Z56_02975 [Candidatus Kaiserbacteria bacterium RIFCSPHIGHO2_12_45_16]OGG71029.1 MAG: hypothetical protein A2929_01725 [Candidatus Kaiserbacteria bacterium RIFCSPLOWO2_01_FULL_45_25]OGG84192.1 MAG: hypothetical protein A3I99_00115 [Candidatus Kaiserbacteria bacterium RIFCSPLOWO2_02_FULL_45_11b]OGG84955.1 MAG: hypothetical protein A3G90_02715 [Candidatus Kaiserbacteria bacterium RIFCSPLOWO2_12_FULL_45_26]
MVQTLKSLLLFVALFGATSYVYYFHHDELAWLFVRYGVITIPIFGVLLVVASLLLSKLTGMPFFKAKKRVFEVTADTSQKLVWSQLLLGVALGLVFLVPVIILLIWVVSVLR